MRTARCIVGIIALLSAFASVNAQWLEQRVETTAGFRGLSVVNESVVWASGTSGTVIRTTDGGKTWGVIKVPGGDKLDFRDIEAFDAKTAYILSIGNGEESRIYKTVDGGTTWAEQFRNRNAKAFFDAIACWDRKNCIAMSDPVDGKFVLIKTKNGGRSWTPVDTSRMPAARDGEAAFAASGTCLITQGKRNAFLVSGGNAARVFKTTDRGKTWSVYETPMVSGTPGRGIFSIAMWDELNGVIAGGNYEKPAESTRTFAVTGDGGKTWTSGRDLPGYRSAIAYAAAERVVAVGSGGANYTGGGGTWSSLEPRDYNAVAVARQGTAAAIWVVGGKGLVLKMVLPDVSKGPPDIRK